MTALRIHVLSRCKDNLGGYVAQQGEIFGRIRKYQVEKYCFHSLTNASCCVQGLDVKARAWGHAKQARRT